MEQGDEVTAFYDPMIAKLIAHAPTRQAAAAKLAGACAEVEVWPVKTNAAFLARCLAEPDFVAGRVDTGFIGARLEALVPSPAAPEPALVAAAAVARLVDGRSAHAASPWEAAPGPALGFRVNGGGAPVRLASGSDFVEARVEAQDATCWSAEVAAICFPVKATPGVVTVDGRRFSLYRSADAWVLFQDGEAHAFVDPLSGEGGADAAGDGAVTSPMPGRIVQVQVAVGDTVAKGAPLLTLEAMKMEHVLTAPFDGVVAELNAKAGAQVAEGVTLVRLVPAAEAGLMAGRTYDQFQVGDLIRHDLRRTVTETDNLLTCALTHNPQPLHLDAEYAAGTEFGRIVVSGVYTFGLMIGVSVGDTTLGTLVANLGYDAVVMPKPVFVGDTLRCETTVVDKRESKSRPTAGLVVFEHRAINQREEVVCRCKRTALLHRDAA